MNTCTQKYVIVRQSVDEKTGYRNGVVMSATDTSRGIRPSVRSRVLPRGRKGGHDHDRRVRNMDVAVVVTSVWSLTSRRSRRRRHVDVPTLNRTRARGAGA